MKSYFYLSTLIGLLWFTLANSQPKTPAASQYPSPMVETTRAHSRITNQEWAGMRFECHQLAPGKIEVFVPASIMPVQKFNLWFHFHGAGYIVEDAAQRLRKMKLVAVTLNFGAGSRAYSQPFLEPKNFLSLIDSLQLSLALQLGHAVQVPRVILSGFSAGYGAIRQILQTPENSARVQAVLLLDGIHASYQPEGQVLADGGQIEAANLATFLQLAQDAVQPQSAKRFLITHSEVFPGTFVSTTEAGDYLLQALNLKRKAVLEWGPNGMQQLSVVKKNHFALLGFAGNTAPDHGDHLHSMAHFLKILLNL
ncbi:hypothetical protein L0128_19200 [candidate division KSB1 bacterium]|nr:hypothetical protein [candidate division KSB1 bacterium]